jgi:hypothetical protein
MENKNEEVSREYKEEEENMKEDQVDSCCSSYIKLNGIITVNNELERM